MSPRNKLANEQAKDARREQILMAALQLFATRGLAATKIADISKQSDMSQGLLYHYFHSKEEIFVELLANAYEKMSAAVKELERMPITPLEKIRMAIEKLLQSFAVNSHAAYYYLLINQASIFDAMPDEARKIVSGRTYLQDAITSIIIAGQQDGTLKNYNASDMSLVFWTSLNGLAIYSAVQGTAFKAPDANILIGMFTNMPSG